MNPRSKTCKLRKLTSVVGMGLVGAAVIGELRKPAAERTWHGRLWDRVPYEFRPPSVERLRQAYWAPDEPHVFTGTPFGVGWSINVGRLMRVCARSCSGALHKAPTAAA
jgi:hypothetical protein